MCETANYYAIMSYEFSLFMISVALYSSTCQTSGHVLDGTLLKFETLNHDSFRHHIIKRDLYTQDPTDRQVEYQSFGRDFHLILRKVSSSPLFSSDLKIVAVNERNEERVIDFKPAMYHGYLSDEPDTSSVSAYWDEDGALSANINTSSDIYVVEPAWRHLSNSSNDTLISYRGSDLVMTDDLGDHFCGYARPPGWTENDTVAHNEPHVVESSRSKRSSCVANGRTTCTLLLVADYRFYKNMGLGSIAKTTSYLFMQIDKINDIYRQQSFGICDTGFQFEIKEIRIHESASPTPTYNIEKDNWDTTGLLESFSESAKNSKFCLAHLFTAIPFQSGTLGLSYVASSSPNYPGGVCSRSYDDKGGARTLYLNTGWSSSLNRYGRRLLTLEAYLVTAHEFGHNWGSEHDPDSFECSPSASSGGKYIMYTYSVSGLDSNNKIFSPCSRRSIAAVLQSKANSCFKQPSGSFCGNSLVENDEECDVGADRNNPCCDSLCKLKPGAKCSDANHICCDQCKFASRTKTCATALDALCVGNATCSGLSSSCPEQPLKPNGSACLDSGHCQRGKCVSICEFEGKESCVCDTVENSCKWCCREKDDVNKTCRPHTSNKNLPQGMPCVQGLCNTAGVCERQVHDSIQRLWDIIENITIDKLVMFMRANIVGTVIILSLVVWIPASCIISCIDRRRDREQKEHALWFDKTNNDLVRSEERHRLTIRRANAPKLRLIMPPPHN